MKFFQLITKYLNIILLFSLFSCRIVSAQQEIKVGSVNGAIVQLGRDMYEDEAYSIVLRNKKESRITKTINQSFYFNKISQGTYLLQVIDTARIFEYDTSLHWSIHVPSEDFICVALEVPEVEVVAGKTSIIPLILDMNESLQPCSVTKVLDIVKEQVTVRDLKTSGEILVRIDTTLLQEKFPTSKFNSENLVQNIFLHKYHEGSPNLEYPAIDFTRMDSSGYYRFKVESGIYDVSATLRNKKALQNAYLTSETWFKIYKVMGVFCLPNRQSIVDLNFFFSTETNPVDVIREPNHLRWNPSYKN